MKLDKRQIEQIEKVAEKLESKLDQPLSKEEIAELDQDVKEVLAELGQYKRFFKRLV